jgi:serine/threonine-protein kinase HipA
MHLKNFSMIQSKLTGYELSANYDLVATTLVNPLDKEELALTLNGKKKKIKKRDFIAFFESLKLTPKQQENIFKKIFSCLDQWLNLIDQSFLSVHKKEEFKSLIQKKLNRLNP